MSKKHSLIISIVVWFLLIIAHSFLLGAGPDGTTFWGAPRSYYTVWIMDLLLVALFYANYYYLAPKMIRKKQYASYLWTAVIFMLLFILLPIVFYYTWGWSTPSTIAGRIPIYFEGALEVLVVMALGFAFRSVVEWTHLVDVNKALQEEISALKLQLAEQPKAIEKEVKPIDYPEDQEVFLIEDDDNEDTDKFEHVS